MTVIAPQRTAAQSLPFAGRTADGWFGGAFAKRGEATPNKEKMQKLNETQLAEVGASLKKDNTFWYKVKEEIAKAAA